MRRGRRKLPKKRNENYSINHRIRADEVRVIGENIENPGVYTLQKAIELAEELGMDLVEISGNAKPPVCRIVDYNKFLYEQRKRQKDLQLKAHKTVIKEIRFTPNTDDHDFEFKARHAEKFLQEGAKVKVYVHFRGRHIMFKERGELILLKFAKRLEEFGALEQLPKLEGRRMISFISPVKKK